MFVCFFINSFAPSQISKSLILHDMYSVFIVVHSCKQLIVFVTQTHRIQSNLSLLVMTWIPWRSSLGLAASTWRIVLGFLGAVLKQQWIWPSSRVIFVVAIPVGNHSHQSWKTLYSLYAILYITIYVLTVYMYTVYSHIFVCDQYLSESMWHNLLWLFY